MVKTVSIENVQVTLSEPLALERKWIGQEEPLRQLLAAWLTVTEKDFPLSPRIIGPPGLGKTTLALSAAAERGQKAYVFQCTSDTRPEDLLITPVLGKNNQIQYHASSLLSAMVTGQVAILDEGNRMSEKSWASLAGLLDDRKVVESIVAGVRIPAHKDFRCVVTMNDDTSTFEVPDYIMSRLQPGIEIGFPKREEELAILQYNLPKAPEDLLSLCVDYLQQAHELDLPYSIRDGLNAIRYAERLREIFKGSWRENFDKAISQILGEEALDLEKQAARRKQESALGGLFPESQLGDFFFEENDPLNPDKDEPQ